MKTTKTYENEKNKIFTGSHSCQRRVMQKTRFSTFMSTSPPRNNAYNLARFVTAGVFSEKKHFVLYQNK